MTINEIRAARIAAEIQIGILINEEILKFQQLTGLSPNYISVSTTKRERPNVHGRSEVDRLVVTNVELAVKL
jgi:hypothetical protein